VKFAVLLFVPSLMVIVFALLGPAGVLKLALTLPLLSVVVVVIVAPLYVIVTDALARKPLPVTFTFVPAAPVVGLIVDLEVTLKVAVSELPEASWALRVWLPPYVGGTLTAVLLKFP